MDDKEELKFIFLYLNFIIFVMGVIAFAVITYNKLSSIHEELDILEAEAAALQANMASLTDATTEEVTTEEVTESRIEPSEDEITISIRGTTTEQATKAQEASTELQEAYTETFTEEVEEIDLEEPEDVPEASESGESGNYVGYYNLTAYPWSDNPCADGVFPEVGITAACNDPALWYHWVYIEGYGTYFIHDTGNIDVMGYDTIDIYMGDYDTCIQFGRQGANVYLVE